MPTWNRIANVAGTAEEGKFLKFTPKRTSCHRHKRKVDEKHMKKEQERKKQTSKLS